MKSFRVRPPVTIQCGGCPATVTDIHPNPSPESAQIVAHITHRWVQSEGRLVCPSCAKKELGA